MTVCSALQVTLSGRDVDTALSVKMFGAQITAIPSNETEGLSKSHTHTDTHARTHAHAGTDIHIHSLIRPILSRE